MNTIIKKKAEAVQDYALDLYRWLNDYDAIESCRARSIGDGGFLTKVGFTQGEVVFWIAGGVDGETSTLDINVRTAAGREDTFCLCLEAVGSNDLATVTGTGVTVNARFIPAPPELKLIPARVTAYYYEEREDA